LYEGISVKDKGKVIIYSKDSDGLGKKLLDVIEGLFPTECIEVYKNIQDLRSRLCLPRCEAAIAVVHISNQEDMNDILSVRPQLENIPIVLILPDEDTDIIAAGHAMHPRYLCFKEDRFEDLRTVLGKMIDAGTKARINIRGINNENQRM
jgi:hypothetical protein